MNKFNSESPAVIKMLKNFCSPFKLRLYFMAKLPSVAFWRIGIKKIDPNECVINLPFSRRTKNPFRSIYFAAQNGAAELSTGLLASLAIAEHGRISMLVTNVEASFSKKANKTTYFTCKDGAKIQEAVQKAIDTKEGVEISVDAIGHMESGEEVARFIFTWSFKVKS